MHANDSAAAWVSRILVLPVGILYLSALCPPASARVVYYTSDFAAATVFRDRDASGTIDGGEPTTATESDGRFRPSQVRGKGRLSLLGGSDIATGRSNTLLLTVPRRSRPAICTLPAYSTWSLPIPAAPTWSWGTAPSPSAISTATARPTS